MRSHRDRRPRRTESARLAAAAQNLDSGKEHTGSQFLRGAVGMAGTAAATARRRKRQRRRPHLPHQLPERAGDDGGADGRGRVGAHRRELAVDPEHDAGRRIRALHGAGAAG